MKTYLIDLDGTMYKGTNIIDGAKEFVEYLLKNNIEFYFFTNNSSRTPKEAMEHMTSLGFEGITPKHFYTSAMAAARYVAMNYKERNAYFVGQSGIEEALIQEGFTIVEDGADFVFIGLDKKGTYEKYSKALRQLVKGAILVGTNNDRILLQENGANIGNGSIVAMFEYALGRESLKIGKPHPACIEVFCEMFNKRKDECIIIGDNLETDILCGVNANVETVFVTSGVHKISDIERLQIKPDNIITNLKELIKE
ncbi:MAG: HAD-IIA family hydrolase [Erysipelotrichales bacterium]|nr:HAD-IIA family hydrolase [Erysipelotrichales bacterium]